jgi:2-polyprenyl-6-hydroxyphenyl methylase/3-demethylubiquinone-9 3-methyltransferase
MEAWGRAAGLQLGDLTGMSYNPLTREYRLGTDVSVNYLACFRKA